MSPSIHLPDFKTFYETAPAAFVVLAPDRPRFTILAASEAYLRATRTSRDIVGRGIFEVFPADPGDPASNQDRARASLERVLATGQPDAMPVQKHSLRRCGAEGGFEERWWRPVSTPVLGEDGEVLYIHHRVEDVTALVHPEQGARTDAAIPAWLRTRAGEVEASAFREGEAFRSVVENMSEGLMLFDAQGNLTYQNPASLRIHGFDPGAEGRIDGAALPGTWKAWDLEGRPVTFDGWPVSRVFRGERFQDQVLRVERVETGRVFYGSYNGSPIHDAAGRIALGFITIRDISDQIHAEAALRDSEEKFRSVFEQAAIGMGRVRFTDARWIDVNEAFCRMLGRSRAEMLATPWPEMTHREDVDLDLVPFRRMAAGELDSYTVEKRFMHRDGHPVWAKLTLSAVRDESGHPAYEIAIIEDIGDRKRAEEALRENEQRFAVMFQRSPLAKFWSTFPDGIVEDVSEAWVRLTGIPRAEAIGRSAAEFGLIDAGARRRFWDDLAAHGVAEAQTTFTTRRLGPRDVVVRADVVSVGGKRYALGAIQDVTEWKRAQEALRDADRRKDDFLGMLSHELRNPLAPIRNSLYVLDHADPTAQQARRAKDVATRQVAHLTRLVDDLLDVTRIARGKVELRRADVDVVSLTRRTAEDYRALMRDRDLELAVTVPDHPLVVNGDDTRLAQVLGNLLSNAAKFTPPGGRVTVDVAREGATGVVRVHDTGVGVASEMLATIFDPFVQAKQTLARSEGGLGLGLALVKGLTELHGGRVDVSSAGPNRGTEFTITLPLATAAADAPARPADVGTRSRRTHRVLVVDDNVDAAESLAELVRLFGHVVDVAHDGPSALARAREIRPDVVLCDIGLPGMDGYQVARALRARHDGRIQLVAVSGYAQPEDVRRSADAGFDAHVAKPADPEQIERLLS